MAISLSEVGATVPGPVGSHIDTADMDSLYRLPLGLLPLKTMALRRHSLIKNAQLHAVVELFKDSGSGSGQIQPDHLPNHFNSQAPELMSDVAILKRLAAIGSGKHAELLKSKMAAFEAKQSPDAETLLAEGFYEPLLHWAEEYALRVLVNLTYSKEAELQLLAAQQGALGEPSPWPYMLTNPHPDPTCSQTLILTLHSVTCIILLPHVSRWMGRVLL